MAVAARMPRPEEAARLREISLRHPVWWIENVLGDELYGLQKRVVNSVRDHRETVVASCHGMGKSFTAARVVTHFNANHRPSIGITTAPTDRQVTKILWKEIRACHRDANVPLGGRMLTQEWVFDADWFAVGFTAPDWNPDRFKGFHEANIIVVADEAAAITEAIYTGIDGVLTGQNPRLLMIGNPTSESGRFAHLIDYGGYDVNVIQISAFMTPNFTIPGITLEDIRSGEWEEKHRAYKDSMESRFGGLVDAPWVRGKYELWGEGSPKWESLVMGRIPNVSDDALYWRAWLDVAKTTPLDPDMGDDDPLEVGIDPAGPGEDETAVVVVHRATGNVVAQFGTAAADPRGEIYRFLRPYKDRVRICRVDAAGEGRTVARYLQDRKWPVLEVSFGEHAKGGTDTEEAEARAEFENLKAQIHWQLRERLKARLVRGLTDELTLRQLRSLRWGINTASGRIEIESKRAREKRGLASPDRAEALMLAFARLERRTVPDLPPVYW